MASPTVDIVVPVWNNPFETRACLVSILTHSPSVRLIVVDSGSNRETEQMLEEFSEPLGDQGLFIKTNRNSGLVATINMGLARSDSDFTIVVRPNVTVQAGWLETLLEAAEHSGAGMVSPLFSGAGAPALPEPAPGCSLLESGIVSFTTVLMRTEMRIVAGSFDESLDGDEWCLKDYVRRVAAWGYGTCLCTGLRLPCSVLHSLGSLLRRDERIQASRSEYLSRWGAPRHYGLYLSPPCVDMGALDAMNAILLNGARQGHFFTLLLPRRLHGLLLQMGWDGLHTGITLSRISLLFPQRNLLKKVALLRVTSPELVLVRPSEAVAFPGGELSISLEELLEKFKKSTNEKRYQPEDSLC